VSAHFAVECGRGDARDKVAQVTDCDDCDCESRPAPVGGCGDVVFARREGVKTVQDEQITDDEPAEREAGACGREVVSNHPVKDRPWNTKWVMI
jgi:hypothetical protein